MAIIPTSLTIRDALRAHASLAELSDSSIDTLAKVGELFTYPAGTILFSEGDRHDRLYFLCTGTVRLDMVTTTCGRQTILSVGSGDLLAWSALIGDRIMTATAVATEETQAVVFEAAELQQLLDTQSALAYQVMRAVAKALSRRLLATRLQLLDLYRH